jgi:predicted AAA+ superfamily ATPase
MKHSRYLKANIDKVLQKKMVFIGGPRQVGKTTLSLSYLTPPSVKNPQYLNWDNPTDQKIILKDEISFASKVCVFDEIHKYKKWRTLIKGIYDKNFEDHQFIVTGSARLDHFRKGGDSLLGRYRYFRLHPFTASELNASSSDIQALLKFGGFPEPYFSQNTNHLLKQ